MNSLYAENSNGGGNRSPSLEMNGVANNSEQLPPPPNESPLHSSSSSSFAASPPDEEIIINIVSASYGPCEGRHPLTGELSNEAVLAYTRDVTPILRALLQRQESIQQYSSSVHSDAHNVNACSGIIDMTPTKVASATDANEEEDELEDDPHLVRLKAISGGTGGMKRSSIAIQALHDGCNSMNTVFGDACPGTSKKLHIHYVILLSRPTLPPKSSPAKKKQAVAFEVHHLSFAEYEPVILRRRVTFYQEDEALQRVTARLLAKKKYAPNTAGTQASSALLTHALLAPLTTEHSPVKADRMDVESESITKSNDIVAEGDGDEDERTLLVAHRLGRTQSILEFAALSANKPAPDNTASMELPDSPTKATRLRSATFEICLPIVLSFLQVRERVQCRLVCRLWRNIVRDWGVAYILDKTDPTLEHAFTRPFLRGILSHSFSSLHSLRLSDFQELCPEDLHPSIPHLRKLRVLDISRCTQMKDETLQLLAQHVSSTLEVLYIKGLVKVSDAGLIAICEACSKLKVLEISHIPITDESGVAIGTHLTNLRALYMRDNFRLTNRSIDTITANCTKLNQLTLWGCVKLRHLSFDGPQNETTTAAAPGAPTSVAMEHPNREMMNHQQPFSSGKLVSLSLWGCLKLGDDIAIALGNMKNLRSLIVSECHRLTDQFAIGIAQHIPSINHLHLRYCKRLSDNGVNAIANGLQSLYSLDLSFCSKVTAQSICGLLESRHGTLSELRLQECRQLKIVFDPDDDDADDGDYGRRGAQQIVVRAGQDGQKILKSLRSPTGRIRGTSSSQESNLSMLDLRCCGGQPSIDVAYPESDVFVRSMKALDFEQKSPGFFARPARWNLNVQARLLEQLDTNNRLGL